MEGVSTDSEDMVLGTAIRSSSGCSTGEDAESGGLGGQEAKEQKFMVFTCRMWRSHGCGRGSGGVSTGRTTLIEASSASENFHTMSVLSFPCLYSCQQCLVKKEDEG
jgi:hypothetical protein